MLEVQHLTRTFKEVRAVDDVSFTIPEGAMVGFVGGNGAGKTTTMRMIMGLLTPDSGEVLFDSAPITQLVRSQIGYMPEERGLYPKQTVIDQLVYLGQLKGASKAEAREQSMAMLTSFGLEDRIKDKLEKLSLGNQQRVQITAALLADPVALILDEPFSGLDPDAVSEMSVQLSERAAAGVPVLFSSHQLDLVERICDRLIILAKGKVVASGTHEELISLGRDRYRLVLSQDAGWVQDLEGLPILDVHENTAVFEQLEDEARRTLLTEAMQRADVYEFSRIRPTLSEIYREVTAA